MKILKSSKSKSFALAICLIAAMLLCAAGAMADEAVVLDEVKFYGEDGQIYQKTAGDITAHAYLSNSDAAAKDIWLIASVYDGDRLSDISISKKSVPGGAVRERFETDEISVKSGEECKVLIWNSGFAPICTPVALTDTSCEKSIDSFALTLGGKTFKGYINNETNVITVPIDTKYANKNISGTQTTKDPSENIKDYSLKDSTQLSAADVEAELLGAVPTATVSGTLDKELIAGDFSVPNTYRVTAQDGTSTTYTVEVDRNIIKYANNFTTGVSDTPSTNTTATRGKMIAHTTKYIAAAWVSSTSGESGTSDIWYWNNSVYDNSKSSFAAGYEGLSTSVGTEGSNKYFTLDATKRTVAPVENDISFYLKTLWENLVDNFKNNITATGYTSRFKVRYEGVTSGVGTIFPSYYDLSGAPIGQSEVNGIMLYLKANDSGKLVPYVKSAGMEIKLSDEAFNQGEWLEVMTTYEIGQNKITPEEGTAYYNSSMSFYINDKYLGSVNVKSNAAAQRFADITLNIGFAYTSDKLKMDMDDYFFSMTPSAPEAKLYSAKLKVEDKIYNGLIKDNAIKFEVPAELSALTNATLIAGCEDIGNAEYKVDLSSGNASLTVGKAAYQLSAETVTEKINAPFETGSFSDWDTDSTKCNVRYVLSTEKGMSNTKLMLSSKLRNGGSDITIKDGKLVISKPTNDSESGDVCQISLLTNDSGVKGFSVSYDLCMGADSAITYERPLHVTMPDTLKTYLYGTTAPLADRYYNNTSGVQALTGKTFKNGTTYRYTYVYRLNNGVATSEMYINGKYAGTPSAATLSSNGTMSDMLFDVSRNGYTGTITIDNLICNVIK